ncbi:MAG: uracil-DNA glycosylase [Geminicoccaceae bacterium]
MTIAKGPIEARASALRPTPSLSCSLCPRLVAFRDDNAEAFPDWHNAPVPSFGSEGARLLIVGLAPGLRGANRTGRPFTGDYAGDLLYPTLIRYGFAKGSFGARSDDGLTLIDCRITNAVRCVPPANKPVGAEINGCRTFLEGELSGPSAPAVIMTLGGIAHGSTLRALGFAAKAYPFVHGAVYRLPDGRALCPSYHCSRYNVNTGRLTPTMFEAVVAEIRRRFFQG